MDTIIKKKWVKALLSGKYKQGKYSLRNGDLYCCLGVLAVIIQPNDVFLEYPDSVLGNDVQNSLIAVNDDGVPFEMIAGLIDEAL